MLYVKNGLFYNWLVLLLFDDVLKLWNSFEMNDFFVYSVDLRKCHFFIFEDFYDSSFYLFRVSDMSPVN